MVDRSVFLQLLLFQCVSFKVKKIVISQDLVVRKTTNGRKKKRPKWGWGSRGMNSVPGYSL